MTRRVRSTFVTKQLCAVVGGFVISGVLSVLTLCVSAHPSTADTEDDVVVHRRRPSARQFREGRKVRRQLAIRFQADPYKTKEQAAEGLISYQPLPQCRQSEVRLREIYHHTPGSEVYDVLFFDPNNSQHAERAARYKRRAEPYQAALYERPEAGGPDQWQVIARMAQIPCLPARFHFTYIGSKRFISIRTGQRAWED